MKIGIIDADLIGRKKHRFPNLACEKISGYWKDKGHEVHLLLDYNWANDFDHIYISKVFTDTPSPDWLKETKKVHIGGTGFFSQIYSLIAIFYCVARCKCDTAKVMKYLGSIILAVIIVVHYTFIVYYQKIAGDELNAMLEQYNNSEDGLVYMDYLREQQIPFWLLNTVKGVPDADDVWILHTISLYYSDLKKPLIILPEQLKSMDTSEIDGLQKLGLDYVSSEKPNTTDFMTYEGISLQHFYGEIKGSVINYDNGGTEYIVTPFVKDNKLLYLISERYIDWGD